MTFSRSALATALVLVALLPMACRKEVFPGPKGPPPDDTPVASSEAAPSAIPAAITPITAPSGSVAPASSAPPTSSAAPPTPAPGAALDPSVQAGLNARAARFAHGMAPDGPPVAGELKEGAHVDAMITLDPSKCYTVVGFSPAGGVRSLKLRFLVPPDYEAAVAEGTVIGRGGPLCPAAQVAYKLDVLAARGGGKIAVQLYSKSKQSGTAR